MSRFEKPAPADFIRLKNEALKNGTVSEEEWRKRIIGGIRKILSDNPLQYRVYGPWWWVIKQEMLRQNITEFGSFIDAEWLENASYGDSVTNILAAWSYAENAIESLHNIYSSEHIVNFLSGENEEEIETRIYVLVDEDMESLAIAK